MHPGFFGWWHRQHHGAMGEGGWGEVRGGCGPYRGGPGPGPGADHRWHAGGERGFGRGRGGDFDAHGGGFGVRRPLRFLAYKLELSDPQVADLARILDELKIERAQGAVDERRTSAAFAEVMEGESLDTGALGKVADERVDSARRLQGAVVRALGKIHALLTPAQRKELAYLIRTGALEL